ncbi:rod-binding protein [Vibrio marisflavi]|uniref:Flagellar protein FlgJ N-terminal domain-containing protein n=1 Tax=Vibrio marisflavi CECT 7928 TaxID=634439 RepID=A0ABN8E3V0_9VIBR|nr:rod-binding protein [Vibrio marisflavi]CAH0540051.1 hypothetical protein VMF7928_02591 [Vibrio marisflavi CECT 7928]
MTINFNNQAYFDTSELQNMEGQGKNSQALDGASDQFEALFLQMMLKSMQKTNETLEKGSMFSSQNQQLYQGMYDNQLAFEMSQQHGLGLSEMLVKQLGGDVSKVVRTGDFVNGNSKNKV